MSPRMWMDGWMDDETLTPAQFFVPSSLFLKVKVGETHIIVAQLSIEQLIIVVSLYIYITTKNAGHVN